MSNHLTEKGKPDSPQEAVRRKALPAIKAVAGSLLASLTLGAGAAAKPLTSSRPKSLTASAANVRQLSSAEHRLNQAVNSEDVSLARGALNLARQAKSQKNPHVQIDISRPGNQFVDEVTVIENTGGKIFNGDDGIYSFFLFITTPPKDRQVNRLAISPHELQDLNPEQVQSVILDEEEIVELSFAKTQQNWSFTGGFQRRDHGPAEEVLSTHLRSPGQEAAVAQKFSAAAHLGQSLEHGATIDAVINTQTFVNPPF